MRIIDLSQAYNQKMSIYPGTSLPEITQVCNIDEHGFNATVFSSIVHCGTHCDAPSHYVKGAKTLDQLTLDRYVGRATVIDVDCSADYKISAAALEGQAIEAGDILLIRTGHSKHWGTAQYVDAFPYLSVEFAEKVVELGVKAVGLDFISPDQVGDEAAHKVLLGNEVGIIENLNNLEALDCQNFLFSAAPLLIDGAEGSFVRAYALLDLL